MFNIEQKIIFEHYKRINSEYIMVINPCQPLLDLKTIKFAVDYFMKSYSISNIDVVMNLPYTSNNDSSSVKDFRKTFSFEKSDCRSTLKSIKEQI